MISVIINVKNAASTLEACLQSVSGLVEALSGEIVVVDMHSTDETVAIAQKYTSLIFQHEDVGYADPARAFAFSQAHHGWLFIIDSDEVAPTALCEKVKSIVLDQDSSSAQTDCYYIPRHNQIFGYYLDHTLWYPDYQLRLFRRGSIEWVPHVHTQPQILGTVSYFPPEKELSFLHDNYRTVNSYWQRADKYTNFQAKKIIAEHKNKNQEESELAPVLDFSPTAFLEHFNSEFYRRFFAGEAYLDGNHGLILSLFQATTELTTKAKLWQAARFPHQALTQRETLRIVKNWRQELAYHYADLILKSKPNFIAGLYWRIRRKFKF